MRTITYLVRTGVLAGMVLALAACAAAPPGDDYGSAEDPAYAGPPIYGRFDDGWAWHRDWDHGWHHDDHFGHGFGHGIAHGFGHAAAHGGRGAHS